MRRSLTIAATLLATVTFAQLTYSYDPLTQTQTWMFENGRVSKICQWRDTSSAHDHHIIKYYHSGIKQEEYSERNGLKYDTLSQWAPDGMLVHREFYSDTGYVAIDYLDSSLRIMQRAEYRLIGMFQNTLVLEDSSSGTRYVSLPYEYRCYRPAGTWSTYYANGKLQSSGSYLPYMFEAHVAEYDTFSGDQCCYPHGTILHYDVVSETILRDGTWSYFDETGKMIREEFYEGGLLKSSRQIK